MCEVAHTSNRIGKAIRGTALRSLGSVGDTEGAMPRYDLWWCRILSRIELDQRSREARLQLERIEWLLIPPTEGKRRLFGGGRGGGESSQTGRIRRLLRARSSPVPPIVETRRLEMALAQVSPKPSYAIGALRPGAFYLPLSQIRVLLLLARGRDRTRLIRRPAADRQGRRPSGSTARPAKAGILSLTF